MFRASDGKFRVDSGDTSVITDPAARKQIVLDHVKKIATVFPMPQPPTMPQVPQAPQMPQMPGGLTPPANPMNVQDLGKRFIDGVEVEGKKYTFQPPTPPTPPPLPAAPQLPNMPAMPQAPAMPQMPQIPPIVTEIWTSTKTQLPVLTRTTGPFGQSICHCKDAGSGEPAASLFKAPPDYKTVMAGAPKMPTPPQPPQPPPMPKL